MNAPTMAASTAADPSDPWAVRLATAEGLQDLLGFDSAPLAPPAPGESVWVALARGQPVASLRLRLGVGWPVPRAWFRQGWAVHASAELGLYRRQRTLLLSHDLTGADELCGWGWHPAWDAADLGAAWQALLAVAVATMDVPGPVSPQAPACIAELPGLRDTEGISPVWQGLGRHFHPQALDAARRQHGPGWEHHMASLLPRHLLYAGLLPAATQAALGQVLPAAQPLQRALREQGFEARDHLTLTEGGPVLERWPR